MRALLLAVGGCLRGTAAAAGGSSWLSPSPSPSPSSFMLACKSEILTVCFFASTGPVPSLITRLDSCNSSSTSVEPSLSLEWLLLGSAMVYSLKKGCRNCRKIASEKKMNYRGVYHGTPGPFFCLSESGSVRWRCKTSEDLDPLTCCFHVYTIVLLLCDLARNERGWSYPTVGHARYWYHIWYHIKFIWYTYA